MEILGSVVTIFSVIGGAVAFWLKIIHPRLISTRLRRLHELVQDWFDTIDASNISDLDMMALAVKEKKISCFIQDHHLKNHRMIFTPFFRQRFVSLFGLRPEYAAQPELFEKYAKCPADGIYVDHFWSMLMAAFYQFKNHYDKLDAETNFSNIENRVKLLKMYSGSKTT